ncbi:unnamed protein product [Rhodiola kirilowii]
MGTGWRRAFCTSTLPRKSDVDATTDEQQHSPSLRSCTRFGLFSNPSTPRLHCRTAAPTTNSNPSNDTPPLHCKTRPQPQLASADSPSPRSPLKLSLFRNSFRSQSNCGVCARSVKTGQGTAIYTAECGHGFHFACIGVHCRKEGKLVCPVCSVVWKDAPLLAVRPTLNDDVHQQDKSIVAVAKLKISIPGTEKISIIRAYDDDESLLTPTSGLKFNPIPEYDEEDEEEVEEFQGFFVNPIPSCSLKPSLASSARTVDVILMPEFAILSVNQTHETYAISLKVKAPSTLRKSDMSSRAPIDLVAVLDVSGSMNGYKLQMLKRAMRLVISSLNASDRLSIVAYSATTKRLMPLRRMTSQGQLSASRIVDRLTCGQGSNAGDALKKAAKVLEDRRERNPVASVMLLSDAQDERGQSEIKRRERNRVGYTRFAHIEIPIHAFAYGKSSGCSRDSDEEAFMKRVTGLLTVVVQDLRMRVKLDINGANITAVYCNHFGRPTFLGSESIRLGDLYAEEEHELLLEIKLPASVAGRMPILTARCSYRDAATHETITCRERNHLLPKLKPIRSTAPKIEQLRNLFITTRAIAESRGLIEQRDVASAQCLLMSARAVVLQSSETAAGEYVRGLEIEMMEVARRQQLEKKTTALEARRRRRKQEDWEFGLVDENGDPLTPTSAWRAAEMLAKVAMMRKSLTKVSDLHGFENARF